MVTQYLRHEPLSTEIITIHTIAGQPCQPFDMELLKAGCHVTITDSAGHSGTGETFANAADDYYTRWLSTRRR